MKAVALATRAFGHSLKGKIVEGGVEAILREGSMKEELQHMGIGVVDFCAGQDIELQVQWIPRTLNEMADCLSREVDWDDWGVSMAFFRYMDGMCGPHTVDRFADQVTNL